MTLNTTYYVRAYATNSVGTAYGAEVSFTTAAVPSIVDSYQGGIVFYLLQEGDAGYVAGETHGLIAATEDNSTGIQWYNGANTTTGATGTALGTGLANTNAIIASQGGTAGSYAYAAGICADYSVTEGGVTYDDWFLPSKDELNILYLNKDKIGGLKSSFYWSSTEYDDTRARELYFLSGSWSSTGKYASDIRVRAVRTF